MLKNLDIIFILFRGQLSAKPMILFCLLLYAWKFFSFETTSLGFPLLFLRLLPATLKMGLILALLLLYLDPLPILADYFDQVASLKKTVGMKYLRWFD